MTPLLIAAAVVVIAALSAAVIRVRRTIVAITVEGMSMSPVYVDGDRVLVSRRIAAPVARNQVVVLEPPHPSSGWSDPPTIWPTFASQLVHQAGSRGGWRSCSRDRPGSPRPVRRRDRRSGRSLVVLGEHPRSEDSKQWGCLQADRVLGVVLRKL